MRRRPTGPQALRVLWDAESVAIVGATERAGALGRLPVEYLQRYGWRGRILPVNPSARRVLGLPAYPSVAEAPGPVDLALVLVGAERVPDVIDDCAAAGVPVALVMSSGFAEAGPAGAALQDEVVRRARNGGVRVVGPNTIGSLGPASGQVTSFSPLFSAPDVPLRPGTRSGRVGFVTQSGALGYGAVSLALARGLALSAVVNTGNEADVDAVEVLRVLAEDDATEALLGYVESLRDGPGLRALAACGLPVALLKAGTSASGARAAASHTGALAASDDVVDAVLRQLGIARAADVEDLLDLGDAFDQPRRPYGPRVAVVTTSGGSGILAADAIEDAGRSERSSGLELAQLSEATMDRLAEIVPAFGSVTNPVDLTATVMSDPSLFDRALDVIGEDEGVDLVLACFCVLTGDDVRRVVTGLSRIAGRTGKPVLAARTGADFLAPRAAVELRAAGIPAYPTPARAVRAAAGLWRVSRPHLSEPHPGIRGQGSDMPVADASEVELKALLRRAGLRVPRGRLATGKRDAAAAVREVGGRAVLKAVVPGLLHKTDAGGVELDVSPREAPRRYERLTRLGGEVLVEQMLDGGAEILVGVAPSPLGPVLTLASGGVLAEVMDDAVFRLLPIADADARAMVDELRGAALLHGVRGGARRDIEALVELLVGVSQLVDGWDPGYELDLNPVLVAERGATVLDAAFVAAAEPGMRSR